MTYFPASLERLIDSFASLPGIGRKSAQRLAFHVLSLPDQEALAFSDAIASAKKEVRRCKVCRNYTDHEICSICASDRRDKSTICVVSEPRDVLSIDGVKELLVRAAGDEVQEVIMATNPDTEGEATALYISRLLKPFNIKVTRLAYGIPVGSNLEFADDATLMRALEGRTEL